METNEARRKLSLAQQQLERVQTSCWDPDDEDRANAVNWAFYAYENAVVAAAERTGIGWKRTHVSKASAAEQLFTQGHLSVDVSERISQLNELRKDVQYGEAGSDLNQLDLENMVVELEQFVDEVAKLVDDE